MTDKQIVYLHGFPGGPEELQAFGAFTVPVFAPDRRNMPVGLDFPAYIKHLNNIISTQFLHGPITLVGFSLGARIALELAIKLETRIDEIILVSAAAPLQSGRFLNAMAGRLVFGAALRAPVIFSALTWVQGQLAKRAPGRLFQSIFSSARGADQSLKYDPHFMGVIQTAIAKSLQPCAAGYKQEMLAYVAPWSDVLVRVKAPVTLWHGTADNWTPIGMADAFEAALPYIRTVHRLPGHSHYSTLHSFLTSLVEGESKASDKMDKA